MKGMKGNCHEPDQLFGKIVLITYIKSREKEPFIGTAKLVEFLTNLATQIFN